MNRHYESILTVRLLLLGGPMHKTVNGKTTILAVASISNQTIINEDQHIVVCNGQAWYTRIGHFIDWIQNYVEDDHC